MTRLFALVLSLAAALAPSVARASFLHGDTLDAAANVLSWFILIVMPLAAIALFLFVHVLPEVIAERRQHPHKESIKVLCILSLFFGGMLWPFAWLWAYTRPIGFRAIYGTERHEDYYLEMGEKARAGELSSDELASLRHELEVMSTHAPLIIELQRVLDDVRRIEAGEPVAARAAPVPAPAVRPRSEAAHGD